VRERITAFSILFFFHPDEAIVSNVIFPTGILMAERVLYIPAAGVCPACGGRIGEALSEGRNEMGRNRAMILLLIAAMLRDLYRNLRLEERYRFCNRLARVCSRTIRRPILLSARSTTMPSSTRKRKAAFKHANTLAPDKAFTHGRLGDFLRPADRFDEALSEL